MDISPKVEHVEADQEACKISNEPTSDDLPDVTIKKHRTSSAILSDMDNLASSLLVKSKPSKKVRRPPNAFMIYANENRGNLVNSVSKDKKCHINTILGNMWRTLPASEKAKYLSEGRRLLNAYKESETSSSHIVQKKQRKVRFRLPDKSLGQFCKKKKILPKIATKVRNHEAHDRKSLNMEPNSGKLPIVAKLEKIGCNQQLSECVSNESSSTSQHLYNAGKTHFGYMETPMESNHSIHCYSRSTLPHDYNTADKKYSTPDPGFPPSSFGARFPQPMFPSYPFNTSFWMYQQAMYHTMSPFPPFPPYFPPLSYGYSSPFSYNSNAYSNSYSSLYSGRLAGPYESHNDSSTTAESSNTVKEEGLIEVAKTDDSEDELSVDCESDLEDNQKQKN